MSPTTTATWLNPTSLARCAIILCYNTAAHRPNTPSKASKAARTTAERRLATFRRMCGILCHRGWREFSGAILDEHQRSRKFRRPVLDGQRDSRELLRPVLDDPGEARQYQ